MRSLSEPGGADLTWIRLGVFSRAWELRRGDDALATLRWPSPWSSRAEGESGGRRWEFERKGVFRQRIVIRDGADGPEPASFDLHFGGGGEITFPDGRRLLWGREGLFRGAWKFTTTDGFPILTLRAESPWLGGRERVEIDRTARPLDELPLLAALALYLRVLNRHRHAAH